MSFVASRIVCGARPFFGLRAFHATAQPEAGKKGEVLRTKSTAFKKKRKTYAHKTRVIGQPMNIRNKEYLQPFKLVPLPTLKRAVPVSAAEPEMHSVSPRLLGVLGHRNLPRSLGLEHHMFRQIGLLNRPTVSAVFASVCAGVERRSSTTHVIDGPLGCGKSAALLQLAALCRSKGMVVLYVANADRWIDSSKPYAPVLREPGVFSQPSIAKQFLSQLLHLNRARVAPLTTAADHALPNCRVPAGSPLAALVEEGIRSPAASFAAAQAVVAELASRTDVATALLVDAANTLTCQSAYTDRAHNRIPAARLQMPRLAADFFSGKRTLKRGTVIGATSKSCTEYLGSFDALLASNKKVATTTLPPFTYLETKTLLQYYKDNRLIFTDVDDNLAMSKWASTSGNPRALFASCDRFI